MRTRNVILVLAVLFIGFLFGRVIPGGAGRRARLPQASRSASPVASSMPASLTSLPEGLSADELQTIEIFRRASASVVNITNYALARDLFSLDVQEIPQGTGSGFVWDRDGRIVTNYHVIAEGSAFQVTLADQSAYDAKIVGEAPNKDLAVLRIDVASSKLTPLPLGRSQELVVGQKVLAIGNPFGLDHSLTVGVISALGRQITSPGGRTIRDVVQTDAAINPGNSGGPLLDSHGRLIGVNAAIFSPSGANAGIGFAVPVDTVSRLIPQLIARGKPIQAGIGARLVPDAWIQRAGLKGVAIGEVRPGGPAEKAGLEGVRTDRRGRIVDLGDRIVEVNGKPVESSDDLYHAFDEIGVGGTARLTVIRDHRNREVSLRLIEVEETGTRRRRG